MARIRFNEGEWSIGIVIAVALMVAIIVALIAFGWTHHRNEIKGTDGNTPSSELRVPVVAPGPASVG
jgi:FlaG/FlaF family flagellin (archaellin)